MMRGAILRSLVGLAMLVGVMGARGADGPRLHLSLDPNWRFNKGDAPGAEADGFDDKGWRAVDVPHDWSIEGPYDQANATGGPGGFLPAGVGWYRKHFVTTEGMFKDKWVTVQFDGVYMNADVWINGMRIGHHPYGYTSFVCNLTPFLATPGKDNVLAVRVDNSTQPNSRWYTGSGIYRHVWLDATGPVHVAPWGTYVTTPKVSAEAATVDSVVTVENSLMMGAGEVTVSQELFDPNGKAVGTAEGKGLINNAVAAEGSTRNLGLSISVARPQLWSIETPALYTLRTRVNVGGQAVDSCDTPVGIREIQFDVNKGFLLNGQHVKICGMCLHQDGGAMGVAVPVEVWERRLRLLKAMGCNAVRCSHNPPAPEFLDLCDRLGMLVMDEAFDEWTSAKGRLQGSYTTLFKEWSQKDITAMLVRDRNHPSIVMWSIGNEIPQQSQAAGVAIAKTLAGICHAMDPTRPVTSACDNVHSPNPTRPDFLAALDIAGYNYVDRWGEHREIYFSDDREKYPDRKFVGTEDVCVGGVRDGYFGGGGLGGGRGGGGAFGYASSMIRAEQLWKFNATHDYVIGYFMWTGIDYLGEAGAWPRKGSGSGVLDTCGFPKDGYYFYQSQWTRAPMVHVFPHWNYPGEKGTVIPVVVYSNCQQVELLLNGKSLGTKSLVFPRPGSVRSWNDPTPAGTTGDLHLAWDVPYEPGTVRVIGRRNGDVVEEEIKTAGAAAAVALQVDGGLPNGEAEARGVRQVEVRILDDAGTLVPTANQEVTFEVEGPAKIIGVDNGDQTSHESYQGNQRAAFNGMALAILRGTGTGGHVKLTARAEGLKAATVAFDIKGEAGATTLP